MIVRAAEDLWVNSDHVLWAQKNPQPDPDDPKIIVMLTADGQVWKLTWEEWEKIWK